MDAAFILIILIMILNFCTGPGIMNLCFLSPVSDESSFFYIYFFIGSIMKNYYCHIVELFIWALRQVQYLHKILQ